MNIERNLEKEHPPILIKDIWENIPENYVSIYHHTKSDNLDRISEKGITPYGVKKYNGRWAKK